MDKSYTFERRYSFNMAQCDPVAESTHLNASSFSWSSISRKYRSYSTDLCSNNTDCNNKSVANSRNKSVKIDARISTDVQSKGLTSRIVKYHETGTMLNRSMSAHNLYSKPGQFPAVTLSKSNLPYRATKQDLSMIRIPPPDKSSFYGNTISSLLRSSSVLGVQCKRTEDLSRENRPIIHPPPTENDMAPTRSVLDVLKEISRKRINSDDLDSEEKSKKYCNRAGNDIVDTVCNTALAIPPNLLTSSCQRYKRQRDSITPHQGVRVSAATTSPEQAKKRVCNYNNDITSSLSSSRKGKRLASPHNLNQAMPTNVESYEIQKLKVQHFHDHHKDKNCTQVDVRIENLENTLRKVDTINPITPLPATPLAHDQVNAKRAVSEHFHSADRKTTNLVQPVNKPRLTLFNKSWDESESTELCELLTESKDDLPVDDCASIPFVKPKKTTSKRCLRNPLLERTQKSKLALMLSGLRGELYQNSDVDELDSSNEEKKLPKNLDDNTTSVTSALKSTNTTTSLTTMASANNIETLNASNPSNFSTNVKSNSISPSSNVSVNKTLSPLVGIKLSHPKSIPENVTTDILTVDSAKSTEAPNLSVLGGFSFGTTNTSSSSPGTTSSSNNILKDSKTTIVPTSTTNTFNFGQPTKLSPALDQTTNTLPVNKPSSTQSQVLQFPAACTTVLTTNTKTSNSVSTLTPCKIFSNVDVPVTTSSNSSPVGGSALSNATTKLSNSFSFTLPPTSLPITATQAVPKMFDTLTSSTTLTKAGVTAGKTNALTFTATDTSGNVGGLTNTTTPSFTFNSSNKSVTKDATIITSNSSVVPSTSFKSDGNITAPSALSFEIMTNSVLKTQPPNSGFSFSSAANIQNPLTSNQNSQKVVNETENNAFNSNTSTLFSSQCFNTKPAGSSASIFGNAISSIESNALSSSKTTPIFYSNSVKTGKQTFVSSANNKPEELVTPTAFGSNSTDGNTSTRFIFGSKPSATPTTNTTNTSTALGGFSFSSTDSNTAERGTFGFGNKSSSQINTLNNVFGGEIALASQHKSFTFGSSTKSANSAGIFGGVVNKQSENTSGFSFGPVASLKTPTFAFGAGNNSSADSVVNANNISTGFAFGTSVVSKSNETPTNKPFSFGSPQPVQQKQLQTVTTTNPNSSNIFGSSGTTTIAQPTSFNFNPGSSTNLQSNITPATNNIFASPAANITTGTSERPIRRATRRLQK